MVKFLLGAREVLQIYLDHPQINKGIRVLLRTLSTQFLRSLEISSCMWKGRSLLVQESITGTQSSGHFPFLLWRFLPPLLQQWLQHSNGPLVISLTEHLVYSIDSFAHTRSWRRVHFL